ncbi:MAG: hypothetical protein IJ685_10360 [Selenomonadaceae bacterium]|nr:hypothetical protein [Selenomonadaceae bacterium]
MRFAKLFLLIVFTMILSAGCGTEFKSAPKTLGVQLQEFDKRFIANVNALAESSGIYEQATTLGQPSKTSNYAEQIIRYQLDEHLYLLEVVDDKTAELKSVSIECTGGDLA